MQHSPSFSPIISTALLLLFVIGAVSSIREQSVAVRGRLLCGAAPAKNVRVKLWEEDSGGNFWPIFNQKECFFDFLEF
jgi:hypothetical protein